MIRIEIAAPCAWLNSNDRLHHAVKASLTRLWREAAAQAASEAEPFAIPCRVVAYVRKPVRNRFDPGNWYPTAKAAVDGLVDAQLLTDDSWREVIGPDMRRAEPGPKALILEIEPL